MNPLSRRQLAGWLALLLGSATAGLPGTACPARAAEAGRPRTPVVFQLDWKPNVQFAGLLLAEARGWYREAGLDVVLRPIDADERVVERVTAATNGLGCCESGVLLAARARGEPVRAVGTMFQGTPMCLMSLKARGLTHPRQLAGRRVGLHADGNQAIDLVLASAGLSRRDVSIGLMPHDATLLLNGEYDFAQGYAVDEAVDLELRGHSLDLLYFHDHGYAAYGQVYFASEAFLARDPATVRRFLEVSHRGWRAAAADPDGTARLVVERHLPAADLEHQRRALRRIIPLLTREGGPRSHGRMRRDTWRRAVEAYNALPGIPRPLTVEELVVFSLPRRPAAP